MNSTQHDLMHPSAFPFPSRFVNVEGYNIHYVEQGAGSPVIFVHGNPTSSYIWRNILPKVAEDGRTRGIALDLLGFGKSDKPDDLHYSLRFHADVLEGFIEKLGLRDIVLVLHDWGGPIGMWYAVHHPGNIRGIALMETFLWELSWKDFGPAKFLFKLFRSPFGFFAIQVLNMFVNRVLPAAVLKKENITADVLYRYQEPFPTIRSRRAVRIFPQLLPIEGEPADSWLFIKRLEEKIFSITSPVLWLRAAPGVIVSKQTEYHLEQLGRRLPGLEVEEFGPGLHYLQEDDPGRIADMLLSWMRKHRMISGARPVEQQYRRVA